MTVQQTVLTINHAAVGWECWHLTNPQLFFYNVKVKCFVTSIPLYSQHLQ